MDLDVETDSSFNSFLPGMRGNDDSSCIAKFFMKPVLLAAKSREAQREIFQDREYVEIMVKGQDKSVFCRPALDEDKRRFPNQYAAFKAGVEAPVTGTPLDRMPGISPAFVAMALPKGIRTVEDLSQLSDAVLPDLGTGARTLRDRAAAWLRNTTTEVASLKGENEKLQETVEAQTVQLDSQAAQLAALAAKVDELLTVSRRPGRPRKQVAG